MVNILSHKLLFIFYFFPLPLSVSVSLCSESEGSGKHGGNVSLDVLPVKGPQGSPLLSEAVRPPQDKSFSKEMWAVQPEHLILIAPSPCEYINNNTTAVSSGNQAYTHSESVAHLVMFMDCMQR